MMPGSREPGKLCPMARLSKKHPLEYKRPDIWGVLNPLCLDVKSIFLRR